MFQRNGVQYEFHHLGLPTSVARPNERYSAKFGMHTSDGDCETIRMQWHRSDPDSPLHSLIRSMPHLAFKVDDLSLAVQGQKLLLEPYEPIEGFRVAIIEDGGLPIELIQTRLADEEIWAIAKEPECSSLYGESTSSSGT